MSTATPSEILSILDGLTGCYKVISPLASYNTNVNAGQLIYGGSTGTGDLNLITTVGDANNQATLQPYQISFNRTPISLEFTNLPSWLQKSGSSSTTLDAYLKASNSSAPFTYLVSPTTAWQYYLSPGSNPIPSTTNPGVASTSGYMTPSNVFAPVVLFGSATITGTNTASYSNNINLPTANNSIQTITITATGGTWTYTYNNQTTAAQAYNVSASSLQTAINALSTTGSGAFSVTSPSSGTYVIQAVDSFSIATPNVLTSSVTGTSLTGTGASASLQNASNAAWSLVNTASSGHYTILAGSTADGIYQTANINYDATASDIQTALTALLPIGGGNVTVTGSAGTFAIKFGGILQNQPFAYNFLTINQGTLSGGTAKLKQTTIGGLQGYTGPATTNASITTTVNGTCALTVTANAVDSSGVFHSGRSFTATLSSATSGTVIALTPTNAGDRIMRVTNVAVSGTATAGAFDLISQLDR